jgi:hypothetical protein
MPSRSSALAICDNCCPDKLIEAWEIRVYELREVRGHEETLQIIDQGYLRANNREKQLEVSMVA